MMRTEAFETQWALLSYLGKNVNDRSLVQRMMKRWEVFKQDGMYHLVVGEGKEEKKSEWVVVKVDDGELIRLRERNEKLLAAYKKLSKEKDEYMYMYDHLVYFYGKFQERKNFVEKKVYWQTTQKNEANGTQETMEMNRPSVYERYNFTYWADEKAEEEAVEKIMAKRKEDADEIPF